MDKKTLYQLYVVIEHPYAEWEHLAVAALHTMNVEARTHIEILQGPAKAQRLPGHKQQYKSRTGTGSPTGGLGRRRALRRTASADDRNPIAAFIGKRSVYGISLADAPAYYSTCIPRNEHISS